MYALHDLFVFFYSSSLCAFISFITLDFKMHALLDCWYDHASTVCTVESCALYFPFKIYFFKIHVFCLILIGLRNGCQFWYHTCIYCHWGQITETNGWKKTPFISTLFQNNAGCMNTFLLLKCWFGGGATYVVLWFCFYIFVQCTMY